MTFLGPRDRPLFNNEMKMIDRLWSKHVNKRRIDRFPTYIAVNLGLFTISFSLLCQGPIHSSPITSASSLSKLLLALSWGLGGLVALVGSLSGTKYFFPKMRRVQSYFLGLAACPAMFVGLFYYAFAYAKNIDHATSSFATSLGFLIALASLVNMFNFTLEIRRINNNVSLVEKYINRD